MTRGRIGLIQQFHTDSIYDTRTYLGGLFSFSTHHETKDKQTVSQSSTTTPHRGITFV